jgi:uncharacterized protein (TIGR02246 family)
MTMKRWRAALSLLVLLAACAPAAPRTAPAPRAEIMAVVEGSAEAWNRGDLEGWMAQYLDSPETTFAGRSGFLRGREAIRDLYRRAYWSEGPPPSRLRFEEVEVTPLGGEHALVKGRYLLSDSRTAAKTAEGLFSLVMVRTREGWKILHDHSS